MLTPLNRRDNKLSIITNDAKSTGTEMTNIIKMFSVRNAMIKLFITQACSLKSTHHSFVKYYRLA
jgi:hypothetical protein